MSTRERILTIRLLDKVLKHPMYAKVLGIEGVQPQGGAESLIPIKEAELSREL